MNDDDVQRLLRSSDPARALPLLEADRLRHLADQAMQEPPARRTPSRARARARARRRFGSRRAVIGGITGLAGAAAAAAIAIPLALAPAASTGVVALKAPAPGGPEAICAPVTAQALHRAADTAFLGTVTNVSGDTVSLHVDRRYTGELGDVVTVPQGSRTDIDGGLPVFAPGDHYLVASADGTALTCGSTGADSSALRAVYDRAFN